jgi:hypothetical protein
MAEVPVAGVPTVEDKPEIDTTGTSSTDEVKGEPQTTIPAKEPTTMTHIEEAKPTGSKTEQNNGSTTTDPDETTFEKDEDDYSEYLTFGNLFKVALVSAVFAGVFWWIGGMRLVYRYVPGFKGRGYKRVASHDLEK